jgi:undecaprenyl-diphosphatase
MTSLLQILLLGVIQGLTEFLPISSDGHLAVGQLLLGMHESNLAVSVILHAGTLLATFVFFRRRLRAIASDLLTLFNNPKHVLAQDAGRDAFVVVLASVPTAVIGLSLKPRVEAWTTDSSAIALGFVLTALALVSTRFAPVATRTTVNAWGAVFVGVAQALAVAPGLSRSGVTIAALLWLGVRSERAFELSMLIGLPAIFGAVLLEGLETWSEHRFGPDLIAGACVAGVVGFVALYWLRSLVTRGRLFWFAAYLMPLAVWTYFEVR